MTLSDAMTPMKLDTGFLDFDPVSLAPTGQGALSGLRFAIKDVMDIAGTVTGMGHPLWRDTHQAATTTADCVQRMLLAGAELVGKTHTDELTYSLAGQNMHYGTPPNPAAPWAIPGGSSSGSASVTAAGLVDFALGTDTGGSVRVPASYCGIYGMRPTIGAIDSGGVANLAVSFDTVGWFARDPGILQAVGHELLPAGIQPPLTRICLLREGLAAAGPDLAAQARALVKARVPLTRGEDCSLGSLEHFFTPFRTVQAFEAWRCFGAWISANQPRLGPGIRERFAIAATISEQEYLCAQAACAGLRETVRAQLADSTVLCLPTTPTAAVPLDASVAQVDATRLRTLCVLAVAGIAGLPQVSLPLLRGDQGPVGLSLVGPAGSDRQLLALAVSIARQQDTL